MWLKTVDGPYINLSRFCALLIEPMEDGDGFELLAAMDLEDEGVFVVIAENAVEAALVKMRDYLMESLNRENKSNFIPYSVTLQ